MKLLTLAARDLFRNLQRTLITLAAVAFGLVFVHLMITIQTGQYDEMFEKGISGQAGHVVVQEKDYQEERDDGMLVPDASKVAAEMKQALPDATITPRLQLQGLLTSTTGASRVSLNAGIPEAEAAVQELDERVVEGEWLSDDQGIVLGEQLARSLGVSIGDKVVYRGKHADQPEETSRLFRVKGMFRTGSATIDGMVAVATLHAAQELLDGRDVAHQVAAHLPTATGSEQAVEAVRAVITDDSLAVLHWKQAIPELYALIEVDRISGDVMMSILGLIVVMSVVNTVLMSALERTREFGVMLAIGLKPRQLSTLILMEGAVLGVAGSLLGLVLGIAVSSYFVHYGLDIASMAGTDTIETGGVVLDGVMYGAWNPLRMFNYTVAAIVCTTLAALYPAFHVSRLQPVDAMRHV